MAHKTTRLEIRIAPEDLERIKAKAREANVSLSDFVVARCLRAPRQSGLLLDRMTELEAKIRRMEDAQRGWVSAGVIRG